MRYKGKMEKEKQTRTSEKKNVEGREGRIKGEEKEEKKKKRNVNKRKNDKEG